MKILYVAHGNFWGATWPYEFIDHYLTLTLKELGHTVSVYNLFQHSQASLETVTNALKGQTLSSAQKMSALVAVGSMALPAFAEKVQPDLILHTVGILSLKQVDALKKMGYKTAVWFLDDPQEIDSTSQKALHYDHVFTVESACLDAYHNRGVKNVGFLPLGCYPPIHKSYAPEEKYVSDLCFIGVPFPTRVEFFDSIADFLKDYNVKIIGGGENIGDAADPWLWKR